jgi:predicted DNA-binding transcriptional regulator AlpA
VVAPDPPAAHARDDLLTIDEVRRALRIGRSLAYRLCTDGTIPSARIASVGSRRGRLVVRRQDLEAYVDRLFGSRPTPAKLPAPK